MLMPARQAIATELYARSEIVISVQVVQQDGGLLAAAVNAATLALIDAGVGMRDLVVACTAGSFDGCAVLDVNHAEASAQGAQLTVGLMPKSGQLAMVHMGDRMHMDKFEPLLSLAQTGVPRRCHLLGALGLTCGCAPQAPPCFMPRCAKRCCATRG